jgi:ubiquinone/menaquinone biosynthesis C-methylase UbiE
VDILHGDLETLGGSKIKENTLDFAIASNVFFQIKKKKSFLEEISRSLRPKGKLLLIDWSGSFHYFGPDPDSLLDSTDARFLCEQNGFKYRKHVPTGKYHYGIIFEKTL